MDANEALTSVVDGIKAILASLYGLLKSVIDFLVQHPEVLVFAFGFFIGYRVGMFFGKDKAEEDVYSYLSGGMKLDD